MLFNCDAVPVAEEDNGGNNAEEDLEEDMNVD